jgi:hypothetical protein
VILPDLIISCTKRWSKVINEPDNEVIILIFS